LIGQRDPRCVATTIRHAVKSIETRFVTVAEGAIYSVKKSSKETAAQGQWKPF
jgi:hypothetical protein